MSTVLAIVKGTMQRQDQYMLGLSGLQPILKANISDLVKDKCQWIVGDGDVAGDIDDHSVVDGVLILTNTTIQRGRSYFDLPVFAIFVVQVFVHLCLCNISNPGLLGWIHWSIRVSTEEYSRYSGGSQGTCAPSPSQPLGAKRLAHFTTQGFHPNQRIDISFKVIVYSLIFQHSYYSPLNQTG